MVVSGAFFLCRMFQPLVSPSSALTSGRVGRNFYGHLAFLPAHMPGGRVRVYADALLADSGLACDTFNKITRLHLRPDATFDTRLTELEGFFAGRPFTWWLGPDTEPHNLGTELERRGLCREESSVGMNLDLSRLPAAVPETAAPLIVRPVRRPSELADYAALMASNWDPPDISVPRAYAGAQAALLAPRCPLHFVVGYAAGEAVCGAEFRLGPGTLAGIYGLVTPAARRRRGFATHLLWSALRDLREAGFTHATLQASAMGQNLYRRMGFQPYGDWVEYSGVLNGAR